MQHHVPFDATTAWLWWSLLRAETAMHEEKPSVQATCLRNF